ncbi:MAG: hypothetical protein WAK60_07820 [Sedimentisphaerales bacterium]
MNNKFNGKIYYLCFDNPQPTGGNKKAYRHVDLLNKNGFNAYVLHHTDGFRYTAFVNATKVAYLSAAKLGPEDFLVVPEDYGPNSSNLAPGIKKVIFNQNAYYSFAHYSIEKDNMTIPYRNKDYKAVIAVSEDNINYLAYAFPGLKIFRIHNSIDASIFSSNKNKQKAVCFMTRKHANEVQQVINILKFRNSLGDFKLVPIENKTEKEVAEIMKTSLIYLAFGYPEGCPLSIAEAMSCGCYVIGYHGFGGRELMSPAFSTPVEAADIIHFANSAEEIINICNSSPQIIEEKGRQASDFIRANYSPGREERDLIDIWSKILSLSD